MPASAGIANLFGPVLFTQIFAVAIAGGRDMAFERCALHAGIITLLFAAVTGWLVTRKRA